MKSIIFTICLLVGFATQAQKISPKFEKEGNLVKATYYYNNGKVKQQGYFSNKKLTGTWVSYDIAGNKTGIANYKEGKKVGKWVIYAAGVMREINYDNNKIISAKILENTTEVAIQ